MAEGGPQITGVPETEIVITVGGTETGIARETEVVIEVGTETEVVIEVGTETEVVIEVGTETETVGTSIGTETMTETGIATGTAIETAGTRTEGEIGSGSIKAVVILPGGVVSTATPANSLTRRFCIVWASMLLYRTYIRNTLEPSYVCLQYQ